MFKQLLVYLACDCQNMHAIIMSCLFVEFMKQYDDFIWTLTKSLYVWFWWCVIEVVDRIVVLYAWWGVSFLTKRIESKCWCSVCCVCVCVCTLVKIYGMHDVDLPLDEQDVRFAYQYVSVVFLNFKLYFMWCQAKCHPCLFSKCTTLTSIFGLFVLMKSIE